jgi:hypothetical protein
MARRVCTALAPISVFMLTFALFGLARAQQVVEKNAPAQVFQSFNSSHGRREAWTAYGSDIAVTSVKGSLAFRTQGDSQVFWGDADDPRKRYQDVVIEGNVTVERNDVSSGFVVRAARQANGSACGGYYACIRMLAAGYAIVQLYRFPEFALLQEARVKGIVEVNRPVRLKVMCKGTSLWIWAQDLTIPAITEFDAVHSSPGFVGLKAENNRASFENVVIRRFGRRDKTPRAPYVRDWSWVKGAVFITSESVNSYQMWEEYHPDIIDRELSYAQRSGLNTVQAYLNLLTWQKYGPKYLTHIEDFLRRANAHNLKTTFIFFDDVGMVEPPHLAPYAAPVPGVHNSQMQGCPGRDLVDHHYSEFRDQLKAYVKAVVKAHLNDRRIVLWQTYNEPSHASTLALLCDSYRWIKETGSKIPVSATGGGAFYGSYYSDFPTFHSYLDPKAPASEEMVLGDGGSEHLCTETLDRPGVDLPKLVKYFSRRKTGWVIWELMIGRDNCRFPWGSPAGAPEPTTPFHGLLFPDGRPWAQEDIQEIKSARAR